VRIIVCFLSQSLSNYINILVKLTSLLYLYGTANCPYRIKHDCYYNIILCFSWNPEWIGAVQGFRCKAIGSNHSGLGQWVKVQTSVVEAVIVQKKVLHATFESGFMVPSRIFKLWDCYFAVFYPADPERDNHGCSIRVYNRFVMLTVLLG